jgi:hypothetical protein
MVRSTMITVLEQPLRIREYIVAWDVRKKWRPTMESRYLRKTVINIHHRRGLFGGV